MIICLNCLSHWLLGSSWQETDNFTRGLSNIRGIVKGDILGIWSLFRNLGISQRHADTILQTIIINTDKEVFVQSFQA